MDAYIYNAYMHTFTIFYWIKRYDTENVRRKRDFASQMTLHVLFAIKTLKFKIRQEQSEMCVC